MIRERRLNSLTFSAGSVQSVELPKDAVYHSFQLELDGKVTIAYLTSPTASTFAEGFPFNLISRVRLLRNGSDTVWQGTGKQMAKEALILNGRFPFARIWVDQNSTTGTAQALLIKTINGVAIPSNSEGIGANNAAFVDTATASSTSVTSFRSVLELWLQLGVDDSYFTTLVDARPLASYVLEVTWGNITDCIVAGTSGTVSVSANLSIQSYDQDNLKLGLPFGTFKRASMSVPGLAFGGNNQQFLLPRGNLYYGILFESLGFKAAGLVTIAQPGNDIVTEIQNRINSNYMLRDVFFRDLQAKNRNDQRVPSSPYDVWGAGPLGWAHLYFPSTGNTVKELVATYTMDQFDVLLTTSALFGTGDGNVYNGSPVVNILTQEVIPGRSVAPNAPQGAFAGSAVATSAKPGA